MCWSFPACFIGLELQASYFAAEKKTMYKTQQEQLQELLLERLYCIHHGVTNCWLCWEVGVNLEVKLGVGSKTGSKNSILAFLKCKKRSVLAFHKYTDGSVQVFLKCMDGSVLAHLRFPMQSDPLDFNSQGIPRYHIYYERKALQ